jgi:hypothetical protein
VGHVVAPEPTSAGRCDPKLQLTWCCYSIPRPQRYFLIYSPSLVNNRTSVNLFYYPVTPVFVALFYWLVTSVFVPLNSNEKHRKGVSFHSAKPPCPVSLSRAHLTACGRSQQEPTVVPNIWYQSLVALWDHVTQLYTWRR